MSTGTINTRFAHAQGILFIFLTLLLLGNTPVSADEPISSFLMKGPSGEVDSTELFSRRRVLFVTVGRFCFGFEPFLDFRQRLPQEKRDQALILCIGGTTPASGTQPDGEDQKEANPVIYIGPDKAMRALGLTGTPMILGVENNEVKWRLAGIISHWQSLAYNWLESHPKDSNR